MCGNVTPVVFNTSPPCLRGSCFGPHPRPERRILFSWNWNTLDVFHFVTTCLLHLNEKYNWQYHCCESSYYRVTICPTNIIVHTVCTCVNVKLSEHIWKLENVPSLTEKIDLSNQSLAPQTPHFRYEDLPRHQSPLDHPGLCGHGFPSVGGRYRYSTEDSGSGSIGPGAAGKSQETTKTP